MNILSNAIQAIPGEGSIFIKTWRAGNMVKISLKDTGAGMKMTCGKKYLIRFSLLKKWGRVRGWGIHFIRDYRKASWRYSRFFKTRGRTEFIVSIPIQQSLSV
ncbi:MAG: hypothetical protein WDO19_18290 [Bacteroidota bacterium]